MLSGSRAAAEDLVQESLLAAHQRWDRIGGYDDPAAWARKVIANRACSMGRRRSVEQRYLDRRGTDAERSLLPELPSESAHLWAEVRRLPKRQAQVVALTAMLSLSLAEVASMLGISKESANTHMRRARATLAERLAVPTDG